VKVKKADRLSRAVRLSGIRDRQRTGRSVVVEFSITPIGKGESVSAEVARVTRIVRGSGLPSELHAMGTIVEGTWDEVFDLVRRCHDELSGDCPRLSIAIKVDSRAGPPGRLRKKVESVQRRLRE
jgi:uncharacterized protein (TIGR00106 family)